MQFAELINRITIKKLDFYNLLAIHVVAPIAMYIFVLSLEPKMTCFLLLISLLRRKIAYVMLTSIPWEGLNSWVGATNLANIEPDHDFNVHVKNSQSYTVLLLVSGDFFSLQIKTRFTISTGLNLNIVLVDVMIAEVGAIYYTYTIYFNLN